MRWEKLSGGIRTVRGRMSDPRRTMDVAEPAPVPGGEPSTVRTEHATTAYRPQDPVDTEESKL
ncbi:hypothetical protein GCM10010331_52950 [Streptomyces xanthochromogenes]|nr:hypothetical protein GCM10010331_52950 [Streptomyces xanthochromogenes]